MRTIKTLTETRTWLASRPTDQLSSCCRSKTFVSSPLCTSAVRYTHVSSLASSILFVAWGSHLAHSTNNSSIYKFSIDVGAHATGGLTGGDGVACPAVPGALNSESLALLIDDGGDGSCSGKRFRQQRLAARTAAHCSDLSTDAGRWVAASSSSATNGVRRAKSTCLQTIYQRPL